MDTHQMIKKRLCPTQFGYQYPFDKSLPQELHDQRKGEQRGEEKAIKREYCNIEDKEGNLYKPNIQHLNKHTPHHSHHKRGNSTINRSHNQGRNTSHSSLNYSKMQSTGRSRKMIKSSRSRNLIMNCQQILDITRKRDTSSLTSMSFHHPSTTQLYGNNSEHSLHLNSNKNNNTKQNLVSNTHSIKPENKKKKRVKSNTSQFSSKIKAEKLH